MDLTTLVLLGLATWRLSYMLVWEDGPGLIFFRLRQRVGIGHDDDRRPVMVPERFLPMLLSCTWCASVWVATGWVVLWMLLPGPGLLLASIFAVSGVAIGMNRLMGVPMV